jgi:GPH family glycoside/pentoside/hexuronide:cation symporter
VCILTAKILDGLIDLPASSLLNKIRSRWGRRRPAMVMGFIPMIIAYVLFLVPLNKEASLANTIWFSAMLFIYYISYTFTMLAFYATFSEIVEKEEDRIIISNVKSVCDVVYFVLGYALIPAFVSMGMNIRLIALIFMPLSLTILIPLFLIKENSTKDTTFEVNGEKYNFIKMLVVSFKNKGFIQWMVVYAMMNVGLQLFLSGINEFFSTTGLNMTFIMAAVFVPVPLTLIIYHKMTRKRGIVFALQTCLLVYSIGMGLMIFCDKMPGMTGKFIYAICCALITSFSIGSFFSVTYSIPSQLAQEEENKTGMPVATMYFAIQGLFGAVAAGLAQGPILVTLKQKGWVPYLTVVVAAFCMLAFVIAIFLPKHIKQQGKQNGEY